MGLAPVRFSVPPPPESAILLATVRFTRPQLTVCPPKSGDWSAAPMIATSAAVGALPPFQLAPSVTFALVEPFHVTSAAHAAVAIRHKLATNNPVKTRLTSQTSQKS